ncbi:spore germination protein GerW family protein [Nocardioides sp. MAHUQ-72]|uniref:spore germination protein GerW family protein n=1 Tax=unclassified Nocardioides TaxID=2615069 RepID=UPI0036102F80
MKVTDMVSSAKDVITVRRVYGEPYVKDGLTVIPAAVVSGGAGGGTGHDEKGQEGEGGGFGVSGRPAGAYVIQDGQVSWRPAVDPNRIVTIVGLVAIAYLISRPRMVRARAAAAKWRMLAERWRARTAA